MASVLDVQFLPPCELLRGEFKCNVFLVCNGMLGFVYQDRLRREPTLGRSWFKNPLMPRDSISE